MISYFNQMIDELKAQESIYIGNIKIPEIIESKVRKELMQVLETKLVSLQMFTKAEHMKKGTFKLDGIVLSISNFNNNESGDIE